MTDKPTNISPLPWRVTEEPPNDAWYSGRTIYSEPNETRVADTSVLGARNKADAHFLVSCTNLVGALASHLNRDPVALAKELEGGGLVELADLLRECRVRLAAFMLDTMSPEKVTKHETIAALDAILSRLRECGK